MKEMSLFKILTGVFAFLMCMLLVITPCFGFLVVTSPATTNKVEFSGYDLLQPTVEVDDATLDSLYTSLKIDQSTVDALDAVVLVSKIDVIVMIVVGAVGMILTVFSIFFFSHRTNKAIMLGFSITAAVLAVLLTVMSIVLVVTLNNYLAVITNTVMMIKTSAYGALIIMAVVFMAYLVYAIIAKNNGKTGVGKDVCVRGTADFDVEDATLKLIVAYKLAADEGVIGEIDFVELKRAALIASNRNDVAYLQKQLYSFEKLTAYKQLFEQGVLTESEFNYKKNHLSGNTL